MDLRLFWAVLKRFKRISIGGTIAAVVLAVLAYGTPGPGGITPHGTVTWESQAELLITQANGVYGRADSKTISAQNPNYMSSLSPIYTGLANGSAIQDAVRAARVPGKVIAQEGVDPNTGLYTPFITLTASAPSAKDAAKLSQVGITAFQNYISQMEAATGVPADSRITLEVIRNGLPPVIAAKPKPTIPILVFLAIMSGMIMLVFSLENHDPQSAAKLGRVPAVVTAGASPLPESNGHAAGTARAMSADRLPRVAESRATPFDSLIKGR